MSTTRDVDEAIIHKANSLLSMVKQKQPVNTQIAQIQDVPELFLMLFEILTAQDVRDDQQPSGQTARTLQMIFDTLAELTTVPMNHITGLGLVSLDRRQLFDALHIFNDVMQCFLPDQEQTGRELDQVRDGFLTLSQLESPTVQTHVRFEDKNPGQPTHTSTPTRSTLRLGACLTKEPPLKERVADNSSNYPRRHFYVNQTHDKYTSLSRPDRNAFTDKTPAHVDKHVSEHPDRGSYPEAQFRETARKSIENKYMISSSSKRPPFVTGKPRTKSFSASPYTRHPSVSSKKDDKSSKPPIRSSVRYCEATKPPATNVLRNITGRQSRGSRPCSVSKNGSLHSKPARDVFTSRPRKPSVVSTKVKRHGVTSPTERSSVSSQKRVRRGIPSPQTVSLCSSLKMLEEFDYLKRRYKEIHTEIEQHMSIVRELQAEEVRIKYVLNHINKQSSLTKSKKHTHIEREIGALV